MRFLLLLISATLVFGCNVEEEEHPKDYVCSMAQYERVMIETDFCSDNTGYLSSYCYVAAMKNNCNKAGEL